MIKFLGTSHDSLPLQKAVAATILKVVEYMPPFEDNLEIHFSLSKTGLSYHYDEQTKTHIINLPSLSKIYENGYTESGGLYAWMHRDFYNYMSDEFVVESGTVSIWFIVGHSMAYVYRQNSVGLRQKWTNKGYVRIVHNRDWLDPFEQILYAVSRYDVADMIAEANKDSLDVEIEMPVSNFNNEPVF